MKNVYIIGGTMGAGKTTVCRILKEKMENSVFLDGDWCWDMSPFQVTEETKAMVMDNIIYLLNNFIKCSSYDNIIFCWVMHEQSIIDEIISRLNTGNCLLRCISLICDEASLVKRLESDVEKGIRQADVIQRSVKRIPLYWTLDTIKVDVSHISAEQAAEKIVQLTERGE